MQRRDFIALLGGLALSAPIDAQAQSRRSVRVGVLMGIAESDPEATPRVEALEGSLKSLGWTEGQNIHFDYSWTAGDPDKIRRFAQEMVTLNPEIIVAHSTPAVKALRQLTSTMPIVFVLIADPIGSGFVTNLAHPGGNVTGFMNVDALPWPASGWS
jgi:putative tryptophan/tyrosine transport system substrate-binding protein